MKSAWILIGIFVSAPAFGSKFLCIAADGSSRIASDPTDCRTMIALPEEAPAATKPAAPAIATPPPGRSIAAPPPGSSKAFRPVRNPACVKSEAEVMRDVKRSLSERYPGSYSLQETLYRKNMEDYRNICKMQVIPPLLPTLERLNKSYYPSYSLMWTLVQKEQKAYQQMR